MADAEEKIPIILNGISMSHCNRRITKIISGVLTCAGQTAVDVGIEKGWPMGVGFRREEKLRPACFQKNISSKNWKRPAILSAQNRK
jgi:hypothetical protein